MKSSLFSKVLCIVVLAIGFVGCNRLDDIVSRDETGVVIARQANIRSSTAVAAADLLEVVRGDSLKVLDDYTGPDGERWLHVRATDAAGTEGWIEARNVLSDEVLTRSRLIANEYKNIPTQATGQLRASTNLRLAPNLNDAGNIVFKLDAGTKLDIVAWRRVAKNRSETATESDDAPKAGEAKKEPTKKEKTDDEEIPEDTDLWYCVRLPRSTSPAPSGWVYGRQVELTVPNDVILYRTGREFVAWHRLDNASSISVSGAASEGDDSRPGSWVILEKSGLKKSADADFDRVLVVGYDRERQEHYIAYRSADVLGALPLRIEGTGDDKSFVVGVKKDGAVQDVRYKVTRDSRGTLKVTVQ